MKTAAGLLVPLAFLTVSCSDASLETSAADAADQGYDMSRISHDELCSSIRRVSKDAVNGFATLKAEERAIPGSKTESMNRMYREYQEDETWFHLPGATDCHLTSSLDRPPGKTRWAYYKCHWTYPRLDAARSAFRDLNRHIEICVDAENIQVRQEKDGQEISRRVFRAPEASLNLYTGYYTTNLEGEPLGPPVVDLNFQASIKR